MLKYFQNLTWLKLAKLIFILIGLYLVLVFGLCLFKYFTFKYNGFDLGIYNQVFYNSSLGHFFNFTIHPTSYLGDHFEILILLLVPFYAIFKSPLSLLLIQTVFLALSAIPLYLIAKKHLNPLATLLVVILYLFNPVTLNINLFEFHLLALAPFFLFWTFYFYDQNKFHLFCVFSVLSLLVREDMAFVIFMFGLIAFLDKKKLKWILTPLTLAAIYFFTALQLVAYFSAAKSYKFLVYYGWLGQSLGEIAKNFFLKFPLVLQHVFTLANFELILGFALVFLFLPLYRPKYLLLSLGMFLQIILGIGSGEIILRTHYGAIFLFAFSLTAIFSLKALTAKPKFLNWWQKNQDLLFILLTVGWIYNFLLLGPILPFLQQVAKTDYHQVALQNEFSQQVPAAASLITTYDLLPNLSSRPKIYALNYTFLASQQYGAGDYLIPKDTEYLLINFEDFITFHLQYAQAVPDHYYQGGANLRKLLSDNNFKLKKARQNLALWLVSAEAGQRNYQGEEPSLYQVYEAKAAPKITTPKKQTLDDKLEFLGFDLEADKLALYFQPLTKLDKNYFLQIDNQLYALGYGFYPTSDWQMSQIVQVNFYQLPAVNKIQLLEIVSGGIELDGLSSTKNVFDEVKIIGQLDLN